MNSLLSILTLVSLVLSTGAFADNNERGHIDGKDHKTFSVDKTEGNGPLAITFDGSRIESAKKFHWTFGNGETLTTNNSIVTYAYKAAGTFTASLKYAVNASNNDLNNLKDGGSVVIKVLNIPPVASL